MQRRTRNHSCVVAWSLAYGGGNGYNLYKSYELLHQLDTLRPVVYSGAEGEWNNDLNLPSPAILD
jgi:beta-galactosidase